MAMVSPAALTAMTRPPLRDGQVERRRIDVAVQCVFGILIFSYVVAMAIVGGAVLARYMLTIVPLVMILAVSTLWRRLRRWPVAIAMVSLAFGIALFVNPPYGFSPEDNLAYRDYIVIHEHASSFLESHYPRARVMTAWPASSEITQPNLGYVQRALPVVP